MRLSRFFKLIFIITFSLKGDPRLFTLYLDILESIPLNFEFFVQVKQLINGLSVADADWVEGIQRRLAQIEEAKYSAGAAAGSAESNDSDKYPDQAKEPFEKVGRARDVCTLWELYKNNPNENLFDEMKDASERAFHLTHNQNRMGDSPPGSTWGLGLRWLDTNKYRVLSRENNAYKDCSIRTFYDCDAQTKDEICTYFTEQTGIIRDSKELSPSEINSTNARQQITTASLAEKGFGPLRIGLVFSGGGDRATLATLGTLKALSQLKILDMATYMTMLSGSTAAVAGWLSHLAYGYNDLNGFTNQFVENLSNIRSGKDLSELYLRNFFSTWANIKWSFNQAATLVDPWGALILTKLFTPEQAPPGGRSFIKLSQQKNIVKDGSYPFPIYTMITGPVENKFNYDGPALPNVSNNFKEGYHWYEVNPFEVTPVNVIGHNRHLSVPIWSFNREFNLGTSERYKYSDKLTWWGRPEIDYTYPPEPSLGYLIAIFESAFSVDLSRKFKFDQYSYLGKLQPASGGIVYNSGYGVIGAPFSRELQLEFRDAGIDFNLPLPPMLKKNRNLDVIFVFDYSETIGKEYKKAIEWSRVMQVQGNNNFYSLAQPKRGEDIALKSISVMKIEDGPTIIYLPLYRDQNLPYTDSACSFDLQKCLREDCKTLNFYGYLKENSEGLMALTEQNLILNEGIVWQTLKEVTEKKFGAAT